ncbi:MAG: DUF72 domain-containing protein [Chitinophagaceae bacterium]
MEFGKISPKELEQIDFTLPPDPAENKIVLQKNKTQNSKTFVGCAKWGRKDWIGKFYPEGTKEKDFLSYYAKLFDCIELNATFYKIPTDEQIKKWKENVGKDFKFCPKFPQVVTHLRRLKNCEREIDEFLGAMIKFENNLGSIFLMPHPQMGLKHLDTIQKFITSLPKDIDLFLELRNPEWFVNGLNKDILQIAEENKTGLIISDAAGRRDCVHMHLSKPETFIRFVGNGLHETDFTRIDDWVNRVKLWLDAGLRKLYFFMHQHEEIHSPELANYLVRKLNEVCNLKIPVPALLNEEKNKTLFN